MGLEKIIGELQIDLVSIDPFIKSHGVPENDNSAIDEVMNLLVQVGDKFNCAIDILHHARKGASQPGEADRSRGASATADAGRLVKTITTMSETEAEGFDISPDDRRDFVRLDDAKINLARRSGNATWFTLIGVPLGNNDIDPNYPHGDTVQTAERWFPPDLFAGISTDIAADILDEIDKGLPNGDFYSDANAATKRAAWKVVQKHLRARDVRAAHKIIIRG